LDLRTSLNLSSFNLLPAILLWVKYSFILSIWTEQHFLCFFSFSSISSTNDLTIFILSSAILFFSDIYKIYSIAVLSKRRDFRVSKWQSITSSSISIWKQIIRY
jgi:hypothetical protein